jgi:hypothetical protein
VANAFAKRLARLEELLAAKLNRPLAFLWLRDGESQEEACIRAGYDPAMVGRIFFVRWLTKAEIAAERPSWEETNEPGPPREDLVADPPQQEVVSTEHLEREDEYQER